MNSAVLSALLSLIASWWMVLIGSVLLTAIALAAAAFLVRLKATLLSALILLLRSALPLLTARSRILVTHIDLLGRFWPNENQQFTSLRLCKSVAAPDGGRAQRPLKNGNAPIMDVKCETQSRTWRLNCLRENRDVEWRRHSVRALPGGCQRLFNSPTVPMFRVSAAVFAIVFTFVLGALERDEGSRR